MRTIQLSNGYDYYIQILTFLLTDHDIALNDFHETARDLHKLIASQAFQAVYCEALKHFSANVHRRVTDYTPLRKLTLNLKQNEPPGTYVKFSTVFGMALQLWPTDDPFNDWSTDFNNSMFGRDEIPQEAATRNPNINNNN